MRRPSNYDGAAALLLGPVVPDPTLRLGHLTMCKTVVEDSWSKVFVGGLPSDWSDDQVRRLGVCAFPLHVAAGCWAFLSAHDAFGAVSQSLNFMFLHALSLPCAWPFQQLVSHCHRSRSC